MKTKRIILGVLVFMQFAGITYSQENKQGDSYNTINVEIGFEAVYDKIIEYLYEKDYFILSLDRPSGFIQAKTYTPNKKILSDKMGDRRIFNFLIKPDQNNRAKITLAIFLERSLRRSVEGGWAYYDRDIGIIKDEDMYIRILNDFNRYLTKKDPF